MGTEAKRTPLYETHIRIGGRVVDFAGWALPVQYSGIIEEHRAVRETAGLFDVSHMGEIRVKGRDALVFLQKVLTNDMNGLEPGKVRYSPICYADGGTVDDILVYGCGLSEYLLVVNASNKDKDLAWLRENASGFAVSIEDESESTAEVALQGPLAAEILQAVTAADLSSLPYYGTLQGIQVAGCRAMVSRTGYTGEDGFEIYTSAHDVVSVWNALMESGAGKGIKPTGLGCRDTLRFEASMPLYGHELSASITPVEAGLGRYVSLEKGDFIGRSVLAAQKQSGPPRKLVGFEMTGRGVARAEYPILAEGKKVGFVTSGTFAPTLGKNLGMALVEPAHAAVGAEFGVEIREQTISAKVIARPFYKRGK